MQIQSACSVLSDFLLQILLLNYLKLNDTAFCYFPDPPSLNLIDFSKHCFPFVSCNSWPHRVLPGPPTFLLSSSASPLWQREDHTAPWIRVPFRVLFISSPNWPNIGNTGKLFTQQIYYVRYIYLNRLCWFWFSSTQETWSVWWPVTHLDGLNHLQIKGIWKTHPFFSLFHLYTF